MLYEEAQWVGNKVLKHFGSGDKILNIGSSSAEAREVRQPHMHEFIFQPMQEAGIEVVHTDLMDLDGVDLVGDLTDVEFIQTLTKNRFDGVLCCNLLEHLTDIDPIVEALNTIVPDKGILILTVPHQYPYHLDPIDTMFRPGVDELCRLFPEFEKIEGELVKGRRKINTPEGIVFHENYYQQLKASPALFAKLVARCALPFYKPKMWWITVRDLSHMFRPFDVACVVLRKK